MKKMLFAAAGLVIVLALACSSATLFSTANPTATTAPTVTPAPVQEWELSEIAVDGSTVRVSLCLCGGRCGCSEQDAPDWLAKWAADLEAGAVELPPRSITGYEYQGEAAY